MTFPSIKHCKTWRNSPWNSTTYIDISNPRLPSRLTLSCQQGFRLPIDPIVSKSLLSRNLLLPHFSHQAGCPWTSPESIMTHWILSLCGKGKPYILQSDWLSLAPVWPRLSYFSDPNVHQRHYVHNTSFGFNLEKRL